MFERLIGLPPPPLTRRCSWYLEIDLRLLRIDFGSRDIVGKQGHVLCFIDDRPALPTDPHPMWPADSAHVGDITTRDNIRITPGPLVSLAGIGLKGNLAERHRLALEGHRAADRVPLGPLDPAAPICCEKRCGAVSLLVLENRTWIFISCPFPLKGNSSFQK